MNVNGIMSLTVHSSLLHIFLFYSILLTYANIVHVLFETRIPSTHTLITLYLKSLFLDGAPE